MIRLDQVSKSYQNQLVIDRFTYEFKKGQGYLITGVSGVGKTTLLNLIMKLQKPDEGEVISNSTISASFQQPRLLEGYSIAKNISLFSDLKTNEIDEIVKDIVGVESSKLVKQLSGGQKQRVSVIRALLNPSDVVILDEPFAGLDQQSCIKLTSFIMQYIKFRTLIIVSHETEVLNNYSLSEIKL